MPTMQAGMAELADAADSKSADRKVMGVRPPLPAPERTASLSGGGYAAWLLQPQTLGAAAQNDISLKLLDL